MLVYFNADPGIIFALPQQFLHGRVGILGSCSSFNSWSFSNGKYKLTFDNVWNTSASTTMTGVTKTTPGCLYGKKPVCSTFNPIELGFPTDYPTAEFDLLVTIDITTTITIIALNEKIIDFRDMNNATWDFYLYDDRVQTDYMV